MTSKLMTHRIEMAARNRSMKFQPGDVLSRIDETDMLVLSLDAEGLFRMADWWPRERKWTNGGTYSALSFQNYQRYLTRTVEVIGGDELSPSGRLHFMVRDASGLVTYHAGCRKFTTLQKALDHWSNRKHHTIGKGWKRQMARKLFREAAKRGWLSVTKPKAKKAVR